MKRVLCSKAANPINMDDDLEALREELVTELHTIMTSPEFGFYTNELSKYCSVDTTKEDDHQHVLYEVRAEVDYDGLETIREALDPILRSYDSEAYFDEVEPGVLLAQVDINNIDDTL